MNEEQRINATVRESIELNYPHLTEHVDHIIQSGWSLAASRGMYGCEWYPIVCAIEGERGREVLTPVNDDKDFYDNHLGRILSPEEYDTFSDWAISLGKEFGLTDEVVVQVLSDAKAKRSVYEGAAMEYAQEEREAAWHFGPTPNMVKEYLSRLGWQSQNGEIIPPDDLTPFGLIIERALKLALANMQVEEVTLKRYISDRKGEKVIAHIPYKNYAFIGKVLDVVLNR